MRTLLPVGMLGLFAILALGHQGVCVNIFPAIGLIILSVGAARLLCSFCAGCSERWSTPREQHDVRLLNSVRRRQF